MHKKRLLAASAIFWIPVVLFSYIAGEVLERQPILLDTSILHWIHAHSTHFLDSFFLILTTIGNVEIIAPLAVAICGLLWWKKQKQATMLVLGSFFGAAAANLLLKFTFHRTRPAFWHSAIHETGYSFPSGHAMISSALLFALIAVAWNTRWRKYVASIGLLLVLLIGISRLYLGVHYPTDIIAGWLASLAWVTVVASTLRNENSLRDRFKILRARK